MRVPIKLKERRSGIAIVEFSLSVGFLVLLLLGTLVFGFRLIRNLQMEQIVRDICHMYIKGVNFRNPGPISNAKTLAQSFDLSSGGSSVLILSQIRILQQADCDAANPGRPAGTHCNTGLAINGVSSANSNFGTPPVQADFTVSAFDQANTPSASAGVSGSPGPPIVPGTGFAGLIALKAGESAYMVEMYNATNDLNIPGLSGRPQVYARSVF
jgi:hypothetical protein